MQLESVASLWFGLSLPAIVLLYLFKRKYVDTPVSSHLLWNRVLKELEANRPWQKLRNRLLMLVQLLAAALLVLALAHPSVWSERKAKEHVVVVLDRSASMSSQLAADGGEPAETRLEQAKRLVLDYASGPASGSELTVLAMGEQTDVLVSRETNRERIREALATVGPAYGQTAYREALSLAAALTRTDPNAEVRLFTDGRVVEPLGGLSFAVPVTVEQVGPAAEPNVSVSQFGVKAALDREAGVSAVASVKNWGSEPVEVGLSIFADSAIAYARTVTIGPGESSAVLAERLPVADSYRLKLDSDDAYRIDDVSYAFLEGDRPKRVVVVGEGNLFLEKALQLAGAEVTRLSPAGAEAWIGSYREESGTDMIVVDSVAPGVVDSAAWQRLLASKPALFIRSGYEGAERSVAGGPYDVEAHPVTRYITFGDVHVASAYAPASPLWGRAIVSADGVPLVLAGTENGLPRIALTFSLQHSDLPLRAEFPVFMQNAVEWLASVYGGSLGRATAGERIEIAMSPRAASARWVPLDAAVGQAAGQLPAASGGGGLQALQTVPPLPGLYMLEELDEAGQPVQSRRIGVIADARESAAAGVELAFGGTGGVGAGGGPEGGSEGSTGDGSGEGSADGAAAPAGAPLPLWRWLVLLVMAAVAWEWGVYRRGAAI